MAHMLDTRFANETYGLGTPSMANRPYVQMENGNGILKTRGWLTPVVAMAAAPVADMATVTAADLERISKFCRVNLQGLWC